LNPEFLKSLVILEISDSSVISIGILKTPNLLACNGKTPLFATPDNITHTLSLRRTDITVVKEIRAKSFSII
jgi:hypothetical protein